MNKNIPIKSLKIERINYTLILASVFFLCFSLANAKEQQENQKLQRFNVGKTASQEEITGWDIDVRPDGHGLPDVGGTASEGEDLYDEKCSLCHGTFGEGEGSWPKLIGEHSSIKVGIRPEKTVGTFWGSPSTLIDYIHRAMPFTEPQSLTWDETWAISAYVLYLNDIIEEDFVFNRESFAKVKMPNAGNFVADQRPDVHAVRCMKNCKKAEDISIKVALLGYASGAEDADQFLTAEEKSLNDEAPKKHVGEATYQSTCKICHDLGVAGAPKLDDQQEWKNRLNQGRELLNTHAIKGYQGSVGFMPAKGGQSQLSDKDVIDAIDYILTKNNLHKVDQ